MSEAKAQQFVRDAKRKLGEFVIFNKKRQFEDAAGLFAQAAAQYKAAKMPKEAAESFLQAAENFEKADQEIDAITAYSDAAKAYKLEKNWPEAIRLMEMVVKKHTDNNKFSMAAKLYKDIAEMYEKDMRVDKAMEAYQKAADCFKTEDSNTSAHQCLLKVADFAAQQEDYKKAIDIYEEVSNASLENNLTKWSVSQYLFKAALCQFALVTQGGDVEEVKVALDNYKNMHAQFEGSREFQFLNNLAGAYEEGNVEKFTDEIYEYDQISKLDAWKSTILLAIKEHLKRNGEVAALGNNQPDFS